MRYAVHAELQKAILTSAEAHLASYRHNLSERIIVATNSKMLKIRKKLTTKLDIIKTCFSSVKSTSSA